MEPIDDRIMNYIYSYITYLRSLVLIFGRYDISAFVLFNFLYLLGLLKYSFTCLLTC